MKKVWGTEDKRNDKKMDRPKAWAGPVS